MADSSVHSHPAMDQTLQRTFIRVYTPFSSFLEGTQGPNKSLPMNNFDKSNQP